MLNSDIVSKIKEATVAIGIVEKGQISPKKVCGSGFLIDHAGYIMTATHVVHVCNNLLKHFKENNEKVEPAMFRTYFSEGELKFTCYSLEDPKILKQEDIPDGFVGPNDLDVAVVRPIESQTDLPFLEIKKPCKLYVSDDICMCGYPGGDYSLSSKYGETSGVRLSPPMQFGKIAGMMPTDDALQPYGLQTDIIGTGGSSGSPILSSNDGQIIGIAQAVIPSQTFSKNGDIGSAKIGMIYGVTNHILYPFSKMIKKFYEEGILEPVKFDITTFHTPD